MKVTLLLLLFCLCLGVAWQQQARAQEQQQSASQPVTMQPTNVDAQGIRNYLLGPGDLLEIKFFQQPDLNTTAEVDSDGNINSLPFIEKSIVARCRTEKDVQRDITAAYSKFLKSPQVSVRTIQRNSRPPAIVFGAVRQPSRVQMLRKVSLRELLSVSGGFTERTNGQIQILHTEPVMCPEPGEKVAQDPVGPGGVEMPQVYKISDLLAGNEEANPAIRPGDVVTVMEAEPVYITGSVTAPQPVFLREGLMLSNALAMVGGIRKEAKSNEVHIYRKKPGSPERELIKVDYDAIRKQKAKDVALQAYDVVEVPEAGLLSGKRIVTTLTQGILGGVSSLMGAPASALQYRIITP